MFEKQLELFNQPIRDGKKTETVLGGKFSPDFLDAIKTVLAEKLKSKDGLDLPQLLVELKKRDEGLDAYDLVLATSCYKKLSGISAEKADQDMAEKFVAHEMSRLARELDLPIFQPAYSKQEEELRKPEEKLEAKKEEVKEKNNKNLKLFGRHGSSFIGHSHNEEDERD